MKKQVFLTTFTRQQRKGIMALFLLIILIQAGYFVYRSLDVRTAQEKNAEEEEWLSLQGKIDELKAKKVEKAGIIYPFNPNFISDYKGYSLGMSVTEINRLHRYREKGLWINSAEDFKKVTGVHDTLLAKLEPYFKFPDWVKNRKHKQPESRPTITAANNSGNAVQQSRNLPQYKDRKITQIDINQALEEDLVKVYGIGPAFAKKILRRRAQLGAFVSMEQMEEFDFPAEAVAGLKKAFYTGAAPGVAKINVNTASLNQLS